MTNLVDCYMDFDLDYDPKSYERVVKLVSPFHVNRRNDLFVALTYMVYRDEGGDYDNAKMSVFEFAMPKCTRPRKAKDDDDKEPYATPATQFVRCEIEDGEYTPETICFALNKEISAKMPSFFKNQSCKFLWNRFIARTEIAIDGSESVDPDSRATLILYSPLSRLLGYTLREGKDASVCFGAPQGKVTAESILKASHAVAGYTSKLVLGPKFILWHLDVLEPQVCHFLHFLKNTTFWKFFYKLELCFCQQHGDRLTDQLAMMKRDQTPQRDQMVDHHFVPREYKKISSTLVYIRELRFRVVDESGNSFKAYRKMRLRLHFLSKNQ